ncbi:MAG: VWA-like domain-containing protein [Burkholderiaceae bacterium]
MRARSRRSRGGSKPALALVIGDERVQTRACTSSPVAPTWATSRFQGGGGTDFTPLLEEADAHCPDIAVVLTDLEGPARFRPRCAGDLGRASKRTQMRSLPFGRKLVLD